MKKKTSKALTKRELVLRIAKDSELTQMEIADVVQKTLDGIVLALEEGYHLEFRDFGVFQILERKARIGRNPNQPEHDVVIPARKIVKFKSGKKMREMLSRIN